MVSRKGTDTVVDAGLLARIPLFAGLARAALDALAEKVHERSYQRAEILFREGESGSAAYVVHEGRVKVYQLSPAGHEQILGLFGPGEALALVPVVDGSPYPATAEATVDSRVWMIPNEQLQRLMTIHPDLAAQILREVGSRLRRAQGRVHSMAARSVQQRIAEFLVDQIQVQAPGQAGRVDPIVIRISMTHQELGGYLGASRETVTRALADLRRDGTIRPGAGDSIVVQPDRLRAWLES
jgi:CRP/FNR family cyclic AMP-dependent transcriptional regulator